MDISEREFLQDGLAAILLKHLHARLLTLDAVPEVEGICKQMFLSFHSSGYYCPPPALFEALLILSVVNPGISSQLLSCVLILSLCSVQAWNRTIRSALFRKHPETLNLVGKVAAANNPCWHHWSQAEQEQLSSACMSLSDLDMYVREGYISTSTPVSVALRGFRATLQPPVRVDEHDVKSDLRKFVHRIPPKIWGSIPYGDLSFVLHAAIEANVHEDLFLPHLSNSLVTRSSAVRESFYTFEQHALFLAKDLFLKLFKEGMNYCAKTLSVLIKNLENGADPLSEREAYDLAKMSNNGERSKTVQTAVRRWLREDRLNLACAAYLGAPKLLNRIAGYSEAVCKGIQRFPLSFYSPVDQAIDRALSGLLCCIPEIAASFPADCTQDHDGSSALKKAALIYPFITLRRTKCICSAGQTVLAGLSDPSERYKTRCLGVIESLLSTLSILPGSPKPEVEEFSVVVFDFVLEENRLDNGIPDFLSSVSVSVMRFLRHCELKIQATRLLAVLNTVITANSSNENVKEAAHDLRTHFLCKK